MGMFNWQAAKGESIVTSRFWIYWAVTDPLTLTVLTIWLTWLHTHKGREDFPFEERLASLSKTPSVQVKLNVEAAEKRCLLNWKWTTWIRKKAFAVNHDIINDIRDEESVGMATATEQSERGSISERLLRVNTITQGPRR